MDARTNGVPTYGRRYIAVRAMSAVIAIALMFAEATVYRTAGYVLIGWLVGSVTYAVRFVRMAKRKWELQRQLYDWDKIERLDRLQDETVS